MSKDTLAPVKKSSTPKVASNGAAHPKDRYQQWYEIMLRIRRFEERALQMYSTGKIVGFCHVYIGQEAIAAGMQTSLRKSDCMVTGYRLHGNAIARGIPTKYCMAELFGKSTGVVKGKGGSMHFFSKELNFFGGNGIVGAQIPIGTGIAFAEKYKGTDNVCVTMFGDGAARQGALYESFNMAMTWKIPVLYIVENNGYAMGTSVARTSNVTELTTIGKAFEMPSEAVDGMRPDKVHEAIERATAHIRAGNGPYFLEIKTYRYRGHSVSDPAKYRSADEVNHYKEIDPLITIAADMLKQGYADQAWLDAMNDTIMAEIDAAHKFAEESPVPDPSVLYDDNYSDPDYPYAF
jgi:pyruvate dehydrogenase E1 component alpha subunit